MVIVLDVDQLELVQRRGQHAAPLLAGVESHGLLGDGGQAGEQCGDATGLLRCFLGGWRWFAGCHGPRSRG